MNLAADGLNKVHTVKGIYFISGRTDGVRSFHGEARA
jgi:hypothetical protein